MSSPDSVLDTTDPGDDVTLRFNYQHCYAAINAIRLITDESFSAVICENHEDILIRRTAGDFIGSQIKTRELTLPPFKSTDSQIQSALAKFCVLDARFPNSFYGFDITTNHGFWDNSESANNLPWLLEGIRERGGVKGLRSNNPHRIFVEQIAADTGIQAIAVAGTLRKTSLRGHESDIVSIRGHVRDVLSDCPGNRFRKRHRWRGKTSSKLRQSPDWVPIDIRVLGAPSEDF